MTMAKNWKYIVIQTSIGLLIAGVLLVAYFLGRRELETIACEGIEVTVSDSSQTRFVTEKVVKEYLEAEYEGLIGTAIGDVDLSKVENILTGKPTIESSDAFISNTGILNITVTQSRPAVRLETPELSIYCDRNGNLIPMQSTYAADVPIIDGNIPIDTTDCMTGRLQDPENAEWLMRIVAMTRQIDSSPIWRKAISQIHCDEKGDLIIITKLGKEKFIFGHPTDVDAKLDKMQIYYEMIAAQEDKEYNTVDLRFDKQIVCKNNK